MCFDCIPAFVGQDDIQFVPDGIFQLRMSFLSSIVFILATPLHVGLRGVSRRG